MAKPLREFKVGETIWFAEYGHTTPIRGEIVFMEIHESGFASPKDQACVKTSCGVLKLIGSDQSTFTNYAEALLDYAQRKQREASQLLVDSADAFKRAGVAMQEDKEKQPDAAA